MSLGSPFVTVRTRSDYWLYATLFSSTCPVAVEHGRLVGAAIAMRSQQDPGDVYLQDIVVHPQHRRQGIARALLTVVAAQAGRWGCTRIYLTCEPHNEAAVRTWERMGLRNLPGDTSVHGVQVISNFKGPGKHRAVYQLDLQPSDSRERSRPPRRPDQGNTGATAHE